MEDYYKVKALSASSLKWLNDSALTYKTNIENDGQQDTKSMGFGRLVHLYLLEPLKYKNDTIMMGNIEAPASAPQKEFCQILINNPESDLQAIYEGLYSCKGNTPDKTLKLATALKIKFNDYIEFVLSSRDKQIVSGADFNNLKSIRDSVKAHKRAKELLLTDGIMKANPYIKVLIEKEIFFKIKDIDCKSKLDKLIIDFESKKIIIIDIKTTSEKLKEFCKSFKKYQYDLQLAFYTTAATNLMLQEYNTTLEQLSAQNWQIEWKIIAIETNGLFECKVLNITEKQINKGMKQVKELFSKYEQHLKFGFDHDLEYYLNENGEEELITDD